MSERSELAQRVADFVKDIGLAQVYGGNVVAPHDTARYYAVGISIRRFLDGEIRVYSPKFIQVIGQGSMAPDDRPVFESPEHLFAFLKALYVDFDLGMAESIPKKRRDD